MENGRTTYDYSKNKKLMDLIKKGTAYEKDFHKRRDQLEKEFKNTHLKFWSDVHAELKKQKVIPVGYDVSKEDAPVVSIRRREKEIWVIERSAYEAETGFNSVKEAAKALSETIRELGLI